MLKNNNKFMIVLKLFVILYFISYNSQAYAYLDPGTGSAILQGIIGAIAAMAVVIKIYWYKIKSFFSKKKDDANNNI